jgi:hypothetical protein
VQVLERRRRDLLDPKRSRRTGSHHFAANQFVCNSFSQQTIPKRC